MFGYRKDKDGYWKWFAGNLASGGVAGASSLLFVYSLDYARTRLSNDSKSAKEGGERQFKGLVDVYRQTLKSDGIAGLYRGFSSSLAGIIVYRGLYFGMYDSLKPVVLVGPLEVCLKLYSYTSSILQLVNSFPTTIVPCLPQAPLISILWFVPGKFPCQFPPWLGHYYWCRTVLVPSGHCSSSYDDEVGRGSQVQQHTACIQGDCEEGRHQVSVQGCRS